MSHAAYLRKGKHHRNRARSLTKARASTSSGDVSEVPIVMSGEVKKKRRLGLGQFKDAKRVSNENLEAHDELSRYMADLRMAEDFDGTYDEDDRLSAPLFWILKKDRFPGISEVALQLFAIPASPWISERTFSDVDRTVRADKSCLKSVHIRDLIVPWSDLSCGVIVD